LFEGIIKVVGKNGLFQFGATRSYAMNCQSATPSIWGCHDLPQRSPWEIVQCARGSGYESNIRQILEDEVRPYVDEIMTDKLGNLIATKHGSLPIRALRRRIQLSR
jgi:hypothetical protein